MKVKVHIRFEGVDNWNRPVFKDIKTRNRYGSVDKLFCWDADESEVLAYFKNNMGELEYFGNSFGCEPNGGLNENIELVIN